MSKSHDTLAAALRQMGHKISGSRQTRIFDRELTPGIRRETRSRPWDGQVMSAYFSEIHFSILPCHIDDHVEVASIGRNIVFWNTGGDVALIGLAIPMTTEGIVVGRHEPLDRSAPDSDAGVHR